MRENLVDGTAHCEVKEWMESNMVWNSQARLVLRGGGQQGEWSLQKEDMSIGRAADNDIAIESQEVSRRHAILRLERGRWFLIDEGSRNGTFVNGHRLGTTPQILHHDDDIRIGMSFHLSFIDSDMTAPVALDLVGPHAARSIHSAPAAPAVPVASAGAGSLVSTQAPQQQPTVAAVPPASGLFINDNSKQVWIAGRELQPALSVAQYTLLWRLYSRPEQIMTRDEIASIAWPQASGIVSEQAIDSMVYRLRKRMAQHDNTREYIMTVRGHGFRLHPDAIA